MKAELIIEVNGKQTPDNTLIEIAKKDFVNSGKKAADAKNIAIYVKPEEGKAYYVINEDFTGSIDL